MSFVLTPAQAAALWQLGPLPPDWTVASAPPVRWPLDQPWPPRVTLAAPSCWKCIAVPPACGQCGRTGTIILASMLASADDERFWRELEKGEEYSVSAFRNDNRGDSVQ